MAGSKLSHHRAPLRLRVKSLTKARVLYEVLYSNRHWTCTCPDAPIATEFASM
jgi:hypothetical protein